MRGLRTAAVAAGAMGGLSGVAYGLLMGQARRAEQVIGLPVAPPLLADGVYLPDGSGPLAPSELAVEPLRFTMIGDSMAAGLGVDEPAELPAVVLARELAEEVSRPVRLDTCALVGATTKDLPALVGNALVMEPDLALIIIGANDVTIQRPIRSSVAALSREVHRLMAAGTEVVVATCPDLGVIRPLAQPLRSVARNWSLLLSRAQHRAVAKAGAIPVPLADLVASEFLLRPHELFSADQFHPNGAGYRIAASVMLPALCAAAGLWVGNTRHSELALPQSDPPPA
ncbi:MAG: SGNH/GDSL hydrolase family protein [Kutzneria sp.]|nr:SGNH/GDSL hydrolase family protein [Kutzneria sp.]MBV9846253.1 SGNH/GDSL hydrolase family protein [Kutzneria sp.]